MTPEITLALQSTAFIGGIIRSLVVMVILIGFWVGLGRTGRRGIRRVVPWSALAAFLITWLSVAWTLSARGVFVSAASSGLKAAGTHILLPITLITVGLFTILTRSNAVIAVVDAAPLWWLVAFQAYRITGFVFLRLWDHGFLPGYFALPAGIGDTLTGVLAIGAALAFRQELPWAKRFAYAVNVFGLVDLINAVSMGMLTAAKSPAGMSPMLVYPLSIVPTFGVPLAAIVHCLSLWQLNRRRRGSTGDKRLYHERSLGRAEA